MSEICLECQVNVNKYVVLLVLSENTLILHLY